MIWVLVGLCAVLAGSLAAVLVFAVGSAGRVLDDMERELREWEREQEGDGEAR
jgi:hypothetical protein